MFQLIKPIVFSIVTSLVLISCGDTVDDVTQKHNNESGDQQAPSTMASPSGEIFNTGQIITLTCEDNDSGCDEEATYYAITDINSNQNIALNDYHIYTEPLTLNDSAKLHFYSLDLAGNREAAKIENYIIDYPPTVQASPPEKPSPEPFTTPINITLICDDADGIGCQSTYFSLDGNAPPADVAHRYATPIALFTDTTITFFAKDKYGYESTIEMQTYTFDIFGPVVQAQPVGHQYELTQIVGLACNAPGCTNIYYTLDGSDPTATDQNNMVVPASTALQYSAPIAIPESMTLKYYGIDNTGVSGAVFTQIYIIGPIANEVPVILSQKNVLSTAEDTGLTLSLNDFKVIDPDNAYPDEFSLSIIPGSNYTVTGTTIMPDENFNGELTVPLTVNDGSNDSLVFNASIAVPAVNDPPVITGQSDLTTREGVALTITLTDLTVTDVDNVYPNSFSLRLNSSSANYTFAGTTITPALNYSGTLLVPVVVNDGIDDSVVFDLSINVTLSGGRLDTGFGDVDPNDSMVRLGYMVHHNAAGGNGADSASGVAITPANKIVVVGTSMGNNARNMAVWQLTQDGEIDTTFGEINSNNFIRKGYMTHYDTTQGGIQNIPRDVAVKVSGKIVIAGLSAVSDANYMDMTVWQVTQDGILDTTFGDVDPNDQTKKLGYMFHQIDSVNTSSNYDSANGIAITAAGKIVVVGDTADAVAGIGTSRMAVWRLTKDGVLDKSFGKTDPANDILKLGYAIYGNTNADYGHDVIITKAGKIVVVGTSASDMSVWQLTQDGMLDTTFGDGNTSNPGSKLGYMTQKNGYARSVASTAAGKIVVVGKSNGVATVWRLTKEGILDTSFGNDNLGYVTHPGSSIIESGAITTTAMGKVVFVGSTDLGTGNLWDMTAWQLTQGGVLDTSFGDIDTNNFPMNFGYITHNNAAKGNGNDYANGIAIMVSGKIVVVGQSDGVTGHSSDMVVWQLLGGQ